MSDNNTPSNSTNNPYARYAKQAETGLSQREKEGRLLIKAAHAIQGIVDNWEQAKDEDIEVALSYNKSLWELFFERAEQGASSPLNQTIISLGQFVFQRSAQILQEDHERRKPLFEALVSVNKQLASGLFK